MFYQPRRAETKQRFAIKKFKVGAASVLVGAVFSFAGLAQPVLADEATDSQSATVVEDQEQSSEIATNEDTKTTVSQDAQVSETTTDGTDEDSSKKEATPTAAEETAVDTATNEENAEPTVTEDKSTTATQVATSKSKTAGFSFDIDPELTEDNSEVASSDSEVDDSAEGKTVTVDLADLAAGGLGNLSEEALAESKLQDKNGNEVTDTTPVADIPSLTTKEASDLNKEIIWINYNDPDATITGTEMVTSKFGQRPAIRPGAKYTREIAKGYVITVEFLDTKTFDGQESNKDVIFNAQDTRWSQIGQSGMGTPNTDYNNITASSDNSNIGVTMRITATYAGKPVAPTVILVDGEEAGTREIVIFKTDGTPWNLLANVKRSEGNGNYTVITASELSRLGSAASDWVNDNQVNGGLGSQVFGPVSTSLNGKSAPILTTTALDPDQGVTISAYINAPGNQSFQIGLVTRDSGDAPDSYGGASHRLADPNNPYLGTVEPDMDEGSAGTDKAWTFDDDTLEPDEGIKQLTGLEEDAKELEVNAEGDSETFKLPVITNLNGSNEAFVKAWIDLNNNGTFDDDEATEVVSAVDGTLELAFPTTAALDSYTGIDKLGVRVRIAKDKDQIAKPTGAAESGEVEDLQLNIRKGDVKVHFYLEGTTTEVSPSVTIKKDALAGKSYSTVEERQKVEDSAKEHANEKFVIYSADGKVYERVRIDGAEEGTVKEGETNITYYYTLAHKQVLTRYVTTDENGNEVDIAESVVVNPEPENQEIGKDFDTTPQRQDKIVTKGVKGVPDGKTYKLKEVKGTAFETKDGKVSAGSEKTVAEDSTDAATIEKGKVQADDLLVTYIYEEVKANVKVNYQLEDGSELKSSEQAFDENKGTDTDYDVTDKGTKTYTAPDGKVYELVKTTGDQPKGKIGEKDKEVTFVYREIKRNVTVEYKDTEGNTIQSPQTVFGGTQSVGTPYDTDTERLAPEKITNPDTGKTYRRTKAPSNATGKTTTDNQTVTYVYEEVKSNVTVKFQLADGTELKPDETAFNQPTSTNTSYDVTDKAGKKEGKDTYLTVGKTTYRLVEKKGDPEKGKTGEDDKEVIYVYEEVADVTVHFVDENGKPIKSPVKDEQHASIGQDFDTSDQPDKEIVTKDGKTYELVGTNDAETGTISKGGNTVTYTYREVKANVTVNFVDKDGNPLKASRTALKNSSTGVPYDTTDLAPDVITTSDGKKYRLVKVPNNASGKVSKDGNDVTYVYEEITPAVTVNFVDENGNPLRPSESNTYSVGDKYNFKGQYPETITANGKTYKLIRVDGSQNGTVSEDGANVTYVYVEVVEAAPEEPAKPAETPAAEEPQAAPASVLPSTGEESSAAVTATGFAALLLALGLTGGKRRRRHNEQ